MADPLNVLAIDDVRRITKLEITPLIASEKAIADKLNAIDAAKSGSMEDIIQDAAETAATPRRSRHHRRRSRNRSKMSTSTSLPPPAKKRPVIKLANLIVVQAIKDRPATSIWSRLKNHAPALPH